MRSMTLLVNCLFILSETFVFSQPAPIKYGKIDTTELKMTSYGPDTSAKAVVLCDYGVLNEQLNFTRHIRLKVFSKEGAWYANQLVSTPTKSTIKGTTYNWVNGKIVESRLKDESIFREQVMDDKYRFRVTMPDVVDGSIIELSYTFVGLPNEWRFQDFIPVKWSELRIPAISNLRFRKSFFGFQPLFINKDDRWVGKDMPALIEEPYMNSITNYMTKLEIELSQVLGFKSINLSATWDDVANILRSYKYFGLQLNDPMLVFADAVKEIKNKNLPKNQQIIEAINFIKKNMSWNSECEAFCSVPLSTAFRKQSGNSAEINMCLIRLLRKLDFEVYPVVLSTRENGILSPAYPTLFKLNYVLACLVLDNKKYLLDATDKELSFGLLPDRCLNGLGRILYENKSDWIELSSGKPDKQMIYGKYLLQANGTIEGSLTKGYYDYAAFNFRESFLKFNSQDAYVLNIESEFPGMEINNLNISNLDSVELPVKEVFNVNFNNQVENSGNIISFNPFLFEKMKELPFKTEKRKYPIDFLFPREYKYIAVFQLPKGFEVAEIPDALNVVMPDKKAKFSYKITKSEGLIQVASTFEISSIVFGEDEYILLKQFYNEVISKENEFVILKKTSL